MSLSLNGLKGLIFPNGSRQGTAGNSFMTYGGTANAITLTDGSDGDSYALAVGQRFYFRATAANTGATTINVNGLGNVACVTPTGVALPSGFIRTDVTTEVEYDGTNFVVYRIIERVNGVSQDYFKYEDGTVFINGEESGINVTTADGNVFVGSANISLPVTLSTIDKTSVTVADKNSNVIWGAGRVLTAATATILLFRGTSSSGRTAAYQISGRWY